MNENSACYLILQDFGPDGGGWGPAAYNFYGRDKPPAPVVYTGTKPETISALGEIARMMHEQTGLATKLVRYEQRVDLVTYD